MKGMHVEGKKEEKRFREHFPGISSLWLSSVDWMAYGLYAWLMTPEARVRFPHLEQFFTFLLTNSK